MGIRVALSLAGVLVAAGTAWAGICWDQISDGDLTGSLIGEVLLTDAEDADGRERVYGYYQMSNGKTLRMSCSGSPVSNVMLGESA